MTVRELVDKLLDYDPDSVVTISAACCRHLHDVRAVRDADEDDALRRDTTDLGPVLCSE